MSDSEAKKLLAIEILEEVLWTLYERNEIATYFFDVLETDNGEPVPRYGRTSNDGYGSFLCEFMPLAAVIKIISECERAFDEITINYHATDTERDFHLRFADKVSPDFRQKEIRNMAIFATRLLLTRFELKLRRILKENFEETVMLATCVEYSSLAEFFGQAEGISQINVDASKEIEKRATEAAKTVRAELSEMIGRLPRLKVSTGKRGRPRGSIKSIAARSQERRRLKQMIEDAIRNLYLATGKIPTKTAVAKELGIGGFNPSTGLDSSLATFSNKLKRLKLDFGRIIQELELNK